MKAFFPSLAFSAPVTTYQLRSLRETFFLKQYLPKHALFFCFVPHPLTVSFQLILQRNNSFPGILFMYHLLILCALLLLPQKTANSLWTPLLQPRLTRKVIIIRLNGSKKAENLMERSPSNAKNRLIAILCSIQRRNPSSAY